MRPVKTSNLVNRDNETLAKYVNGVEWDLKKLYGQFNKFVSFNSFAVGTTNDFCKIDSSGTIKLYGDATVWDDLRVPVTATKQGSNNLPHFDQTNVGYLFPQNDATEILYIICQIPHSWKIGSKIYPHVHWAQGMSSGASFYIDYKWFSLGSSTTAGFTTFAMLSTEFPWSTGNTIHQISTNTAGISGSTISGVSSIMLAKLYRNDNTYPGDSLTFEFDIHYEQDSLGSNQEFAK